MDLSKRIVKQIPLDALWTEDRELDVKRVKYLDSNEIAAILKNGPVRFIIANVGDKLLWQDLESCYQLYKNEIRSHLIPPNSAIDLDHFEGGYGYLASQWSDYLDVPIILMEKFH